MATSVDSIYINDYVYTLYDDNTCSAKVRKLEGESKAEYSGLFGTVYSINTKKFYKLVSLDDCFKNCENLEKPPVIPFGVTSMRYCFYNCTSLKYPPKLPPTIEDLTACFHSCSSMKTSLDYYIIPESATNLFQMFTGASADNWVDKVCILSKNISSTTYMFQYSANGEDARGLLYNRPTNTGYEFGNVTVDYDSEFFTDSRAYSNIWPHKVHTPASGSKFNLMALLVKLLTQLYNIIDSSNNSTISSIVTFVKYNYHTLCKSGSHTFKAYLSPQVLRKIRKKIAALDNLNNYILQYDTYGDGFVKLLIYIKNGLCAYQDISVGSKTMYNIDEAEYKTVSSSYFIGGIWNGGYIQPQRRGNPMCMTGTFIKSLGTTPSININYTYCCASDSDFNYVPILGLCLFRTISDDNYYE